jgi:hypothetical protein
MKGYLISALVVVAACPAGAQVLLMPDSTNNRMVAFSPVDGSIINNNLFAIASGTTPIHAMQVGTEVWVSEQIGDKISRYDISGTSLGQIGGGASGGLDNIRGMGLINGTVYVTNGGSGNLAPSANSVVMFSTAGANLGSFSTAALAPSPFSILAHQGGLLVGGSSGNDDIHKFSLAGASQGTFYNSTNHSFFEQMDYALDGNVLAAVFTTDVVAKFDVNTGTFLSSFAAPDVRGVHQLSNGNVLWTSGAGAFVYDISTQFSNQVYAGGGRYVDLYTPVPEPASMAVLGLGALALIRRRRQSR